MPNSQFYFNVKSNSKMLQVMIEMSLNSYLLDAIENALIYFIELNPQHKISEQIDLYEVYEANKLGEPILQK